ncbi:hypothetical protein ABLE94_19210 [Gordonia sp. VNK1]|uniref:hypothetical protein n=1 Tax=Gordonia oleivorans TaxID=3156618 RepID=UPI0032B51C54
MEWHEATRTLELTARNVAVLIAKLNDPQSARMLAAGTGDATVHAVEAATPAELTAGVAEGIITVTREQLATLSTEGASVTVADATVTAVPDQAHYSRRPSGAVLMPSSGKLLEPEMAHWKLRHVCEVCGVEAVLTATEAFESGWDYPPRIGQFGVVGPRTCGSCPMSETVWAALVLRGTSADKLTDAQRDVVARILAEPMSIAVDESP